MAQSNSDCIWFGLAASVKLHPAHTDKLWEESSVAGFLSFALRAAASPPPSHLLQLSNHLMTFKGAWHPFEVGDGALALVSCPNPTQTNKMHTGSEVNQRNSCSLNVKQTRLAFSLTLYCKVQKSALSDERKETIDSPGSHHLFLCCDCLSAPWDLITVN